MKEYISTIIYICIFSIILELVLPDNKLKKYVGVLVSLVIILTLVTPVIDVLNEENVIQTISNTIETIQANTKIAATSYDFAALKDKTVLGSVKSSLEKELLDNCKEKFKAKVQISDVEINLDSNYEIASITLYSITKLDIVMVKEILSYLEDEYNIKDYLVEIVEEV